MYYSLIPSLEEISLVRTIITCWSQDNVRDLVANFFQSLPVFRTKNPKECCCRPSRFNQKLKEWQNVEDKVLNEISMLLPKLLKQKALAFNKPIGLEILKWIEYHESLLSKPIVVKECLNRLSWTSQGIIDKMESAKILIKDEKLQVTIRYQLACIYCLEDDILQLWKRISTNDRLFMQNCSCLMANQLSRLVYVWTKRIKNGVIKPSNRKEKMLYFDHGDLFQFSAKCGNKAATEYFSRKLTCDERNQFALRTAEYIVKRHSRAMKYFGCNHVRSEEFDDYDTEVLHFLISQIDEVKAFKLGTPMLVCFLDHPFHHFFLKMVNRMWDHISRIDISILLDGFFNKKIKDGGMDPSYQKLFREFWQQCPSTQKKDFLKEERAKYMLIVLLNIEDENTTQLNLKNVSAEERWECIYSFVGYDFCSRLMYLEKWDLLEAFLRQCISSEDKLIIFQKQFSTHTSMARKQYAGTTEKWNRFHQLLNDLYGNDKRKSVDEGTGTSCKRPCCMESENSIYYLSA